MKSIVTLLFILIFGVIALANTEAHAKVDLIEMGAVLGSSTDRSCPTSQIKVGTEKTVARLYKFKNSRVKKALTFITEHDKAKLV